MKIKSIYLLVLLLASCTVARIENNSGGTATYASLGGDSENIMMTPDNIAIASNNNSKSFSKAANTTSIIAGTLAVKSIANTMTTQSGLTDRASIAAKSNTDQAAIAARTSQSEIAAGVTKTVDANATAVKLSEIQNNTDIEKLRILTPTD